MNTGWSGTRRRPAPKVGVGVDGDDAIAAQIGEKRSEQRGDEGLTDAALRRDDRDRHATAQPRREDPLVELMPVLAALPGLAEPMRG